MGPWEMSPPPPFPGPLTSWKRAGSAGIPAARREEAANAAVSSPDVRQLVSRINAIYEARRGKKRVKRLSQSTESNSGKGRNPPAPPPPHPFSPENLKTDSSWTRLPGVVGRLTKERKSRLCKCLFRPQDSSRARAQPRGVPSGLLSRSICPVSPVQRALISPRERSPLLSTHRRGR